MSGYMAKIFVPVFIYNNFFKFFKFCMRNRVLMFLNIGCNSASKAAFAGAVASVLCHGKVVA